MALTEHVSLNLAPLILLDPVRLFRLTVQKYGDDHEETTKTRDTLISYRKGVSLEWY